MGDVIFVCVFVWRGYVGMCSHRQEVTDKSLINLATFNYVIYLSVNSFMRDFDKLPGDRGRAVGHCFHEEL